MRAIKFKNNRLFYLDQTQLPLKEVWKECRSLSDGFRAIKRLEVRGAPLIGIFAAYCIAVVAERMPLKGGVFLSEINKAITYLKCCRPTAVNLSWALGQLTKIISDNRGKSHFEIKQALLQEAEKIHRQDIELCQNIAKFGVQLIKPGDTILTHCNAGFLATGGNGTALGVIYAAHRLYKNIKVYADETRPLLQGARLTAWELTKGKVPCTLICDNTAAYLMQKGKIDKVFVGADRITACGDTANKIGTYNVAVIAGYHKVPFYVVAPFSSFDLKLKAGGQIPIEERNREEVRKILGKVYCAPKNVNVFNPAFDVTPHHLITAIVTDKGIIYSPYKKNIKKLLSKLL
jgi:methylthioribose-1-phosphate isomerase